jgi:hypothetical protein
LLAIGLNRAITKGVFKELRGAPIESVYNAFLFGALTAQSEMASTEAVMAGLRAGPGGMSRLMERMQNIGGYLHDETNALDEDWGFAYQLDYGMRVTKHDLHLLRSIPEEQRDQMQVWIDRLDDEAKAADPENWPATAARRQAEADAEFGQFALTIHPRGMYGNRDNRITFRTYATINNPQANFRGQATNKQVGRVVQWLNSGLFSSDNPAVNQFLRPQADESMDDYAVRMASILPGIGFKTSILSGMSTGPSRMARGAMDTHAVRKVLDVADARGELEDLYSRLTTGYAKHLREKRAGSGRGYNSPEPKFVDLLTADGKAMDWGPEKEAMMRGRLGRISDPKIRELYQDSEVLRFVANNNGRIPVMRDSNYEVIDDYFSQVVRQDEMDRLLADGQTEAAEAIGRMSGGQFMWFMWDIVRSDVDGFLDPHMGIARAAGLEPPRTGLALGAGYEASIAPGMPDPAYNMRLMQQDGQIMGATVMMDDLRALLVGTQHADARTGIHEFFHAMERWLDPSMRETVLTEYRAANGSTRTTWGREVSEWWADNAVAYFRQPGKFKGSRALRSSFEAVKSTLDIVETGRAKQATERTLVKDRTRAITKAEKAIARTKAPLGDLNTEVKAAVRAHEVAQRTLRSARGKKGVAELEGAVARADEDVLVATENVKSSRAGVRIAKEELKQQRLKARAAAGTPSAGGLTAAIKRREAAVEAAIAYDEAADAALAAARTARGKVSKRAAGARRRVPLDTHIRNRDAARDRLTKAQAKANKAAAAHQQAKDSLSDARAMPTKADKKMKAVAPPMTQAMQDLFDEILRPAEKPGIKWGPGSPIDAGQHYNIEEEALFRAGVEALMRAEDASHTLHYYNRSRSFVERSANHVYFGLYPASYMWGKVFPELLRFLLKEPFGLDAPLGGLFLANNIYRQVMTRQQFDEDFRADMVEKSDLFHLLAMMTPALPWEVPVNAPLWMRRMSEQGLTRIDKMEELREQYGGTIPENKLPTMPDIGDTSRLTKEMMTYAFGPLYAVDIGATVLSQGKEFTDALGTVDEVLTGNTQPSAPGGVPALPPGGMVPPMAPP